MDKTMRLAAVIFAMGQRIEELKKEAWWPYYTDEALFNEVRECAEWYCERFPVTEEQPPVLVDTAREIANAWFKQECDQPLSSMEETFLLYNQHIAEEMRKRANITKTDYDWWENAEEVIGEHISYQEYVRLDNMIPDNMTLMEYDGKNKIDRETLRCYLRKIRETKIFEITHTIVKEHSFSVEVEAKDKDEAIRIFEEKFYNLEYQSEEEEADSYGEIVGETTTAKEV